MTVIAMLAVAGWLASHLSFEPGAHDTSRAVAAASAPVIPAQAPDATPPEAASASDTEHDDPLAQTQDARLPRAAGASAIAQATRLTSQGNLLLAKGFLRTARVRYGDALRVFPAYPRALAGLSRLEIARGHGQQAVWYAERLVRLRPAMAP